MSRALDRTSPPTADPNRPFHFPATTSVVLDNGLRVLSARAPEFPLVTAQLLTPAGGMQNPLDRPGLAELHALMLQEGSAAYTAAELARTVEQLGGAMDSGAGWNVSYTELSLLSADLETGLELLAEMCLRSTFPEEPFRRLKDRVGAELIRRPSRPTLLADDTFSRIVYSGSPYGFAAKGTPESLEALDVDALRTFRERAFVPGGSTLIVAGDFDTEVLHHLAQQHFGGWAGGAEPALPKIEPRQLEQVEVHIADRPGAAQTQLHLGHAGPSRLEPEFFKLIATNVLLGGKFTSRLNLNLRERHGFTYGVQSSFARRLGPAPFTIRTAVATEVAGAAVREIFFEVERLQNETVPEEEWSETLSYLLGVFPYTVQTTDDLAARLENLSIFRLPLDYYETYRDDLRSMTPELVRETAQRYLFPDRMVVVAAGPAETLAPQLEAFGPVHVHSV